MTAVMMGAAAAMGGKVASVSPRTISAIAVAPSSAEAQFRVNEDGTIEVNTGSGWVEIADFAGGPGWDVRVDVSGSALDGDSSSTGTWLAQGTLYRWSQTRTGTGIDSTTCTIRIRDGSDTETDSAAYTLTAEVEI